jgi:hypothetical protein
MGAALSAFILSRRAGLKADFPREAGAWDRRPIVLLPSPLTSTGTPFLTHVHTDFYERARRYVEAGGFLYASVAADAAVPDMDGLFGARLADTNTTAEVRIRIVKRLGELAVGDTFAFKAPSSGMRAWGSLLEVSRGEVVAEDADGNPALVLHRLGAGKTLLAAFPFESWVAAIPSAFDRLEKRSFLDLLYRAIRVESGVAPIVAADDPSVEVTALRGAGAGAYAVAVNHGPSPRTVTVATTLPIRTVRRLQPDGAQPIEPVGGRWTMTLEPHDGAVVELR